MKDSTDSLKDGQVEIQTQKSVAWIDATIPFNISLGPVSTLIQLLILGLNGTVIDVALAITLFSAVSVPAALVWGLVSDRFEKRRSIIVASYLASTIVLVLFLFANTEYWVSLLYATFSFITTASTTPLNLLVMETEQKQKWATALARLSMVTSIGQMIGVILGVAWGILFPLVYARA
ncbi:MAG TPA: MFS transporter [Candidatus Sulfotelmatobacter sp.]|nr:MFS transporter [Candidatus Sulfotelmatobacter sp.]